MFMVKRKSFSLYINSDILIPNLEAQISRYVTVLKKTIIVIFRTNAKKYMLLCGCQQS